MVDLNIKKVPAIEKLLDYTASGIGAIAGPMLAPWKASREGKAKLISVRKEAEARIIQAESEGKSLKIIAKAQSEAKELYIGARNEESLRTVEIIRNDITQWIEFQERKRLANIKNVVSEAANMLTDKEIADHEPDPDWTARFFNCAQDISSEDMQKIWAKILAGEVERPGKTSLRAMDTLRNMTRKDAELFEKIASFVIGSEFIFYDDIYTYMQHYEAIDFDNILHLTDCGLINAQNLKREISRKNDFVFKYLDNALMITRNYNVNDNVKIMLYIPCFKLTATGKELLSVVQLTNMPQMEYLQHFSRFLQSKNCQLFYLKGPETLPGGNTEYRERIKIEPKSEQSKKSAK